MMQYRDSDSIALRREPRRQVEMFARLRRRAHWLTIMLKDFSHGGARIEGVVGLVPDEAVHVALPGCRPQMAFVAWSNGVSAGLEFAEPLPAALYDALVSGFALGQSSGEHAPQQPPLAQAA
jgi:hypothetical protein